MPNSKVLDNTTHSGLQDLLSCFAESQASYSFIAASEKVAQAWGELLARLDRTQRHEVACLHLEGIEQEMTSGLSETLREMDEASGLYAMLVDFTHEPERGRLVYRSARLAGLRVVLLSQDPTGIPVGHHSLGPFIYKESELGSADSRIGNTLASLLRYLYFSRVLMKLESTLRERHYAAVVRESHIVFESALRYLVDYVARVESIKPPQAKKTHQMLRFLETYESKYELTLDEKRLGPMGRLRNLIVHNLDVDVSEEQARSALTYVDNFVRYNVGPNLQGE